MVQNDSDYQQKYFKEYYQQHKQEIKERTRQRYLANREHCLEQGREHQATPEAKERKIVRQREDRKLRPQVHRARKLVNRAVKSGKLIRGVCEKCGDAHVEAHHDSYERGKELEVRWFCRYHHKLIEGKILVPRPENTGGSPTTTAPI